MAESSDGIGMRTSHHLLTYYLIVLSLAIATSALAGMGQEATHQTQAQALDSNKLEHLIHHAPRHTANKRSTKRKSRAAAARYSLGRVAYVSGLHLQNDDLAVSGVGSAAESSSSYGGHYDRGKGDRRPSTTTTGMPKFLPDDGPRPYIPDPSFLPVDSEVKVLQGHEAKLQCTVQNLGARQISWQKVGTDNFISIGTEVWVRDPNLMVQHYSWPADVEDWNLIFTRARLHDSGDYVCQIISTEKKEIRVRLSVIARPVITIESKTYFELGEAIYLKCNMTEVGGFFKKNESIQWFKDGDRIGNGSIHKAYITHDRRNGDETASQLSELFIESAKARDQGTYICRSSSLHIATKDIIVISADSSNVKRGTGTSHTQVHTSKTDGNAATFFPPFLACPVTVLLVTVSTVLVHLLTT